MKKYIAILLSILLMVSLAACGEDSGNADQSITRSPDITTTCDPNHDPKQDSTTPAPTDGGSSDVYAFVSNGITLVPGAPFDPSSLPQAESTYEVPNCAIEGTNIVYNYGTFELSAYQGSQKAVIFSIYLIDPNLTTPEGLRLGDSQDKVAQIYGTGYTENGSAWVYTASDTQLMILFQHGTVISIEYSMLVQ